MLAHSYFFAEKIRLLEINIQEIVSIVADGEPIFASAQTGEDGIFFQFRTVRPDLLPGLLYPEGNPGQGETVAVSEMDQA